MHHISISLVTFESRVKHSEYSLCRAISHWPSCQQEGIKCNRIHSSVYIIFDLRILKSYAGMRLLLQSYCIPVTNSIRTSQTCRLLHTACKVLHYQLQSLVAWYNLVDCGNPQSLWSREYKGNVSNRVQCVYFKQKRFHPTLRVGRWSYAHNLT